MTPMEEAKLGQHPSPNTKIDKLSDQEILEAWFGGAFLGPRFHGGKSPPARIPELEKYMSESYLASWRKVAPIRLSQLARHMNEFWYGYKDSFDKPWKPQPGGSFERKNLKVRLA